MKRQIFLFLLVNLLCLHALVDLNFANCGREGDIWIANNVTAKQVMSYRRNNTIHLCGISQSNAILSDFMMNIEFLGTFFPLKTQSLSPPDQMKANKTFCLTYTFILPTWRLGNCTLSFQFRDQDANELACTMVTFEL